MFLLLLLEGLLPLLILLLVHTIKWVNTKKKKKICFIFQGEMLSIVTSVVCLCKSVNPDYFILGWIVWEVNFFYIISVVLNYQIKYRRVDN